MTEQEIGTDNNTIGWPESEPDWRVIGFVGLVIVGVSVLYWFVPGWTGQSLEDQALRGDAYGVLNTLFTGLAFGGVIVAIWLQRNELALQRRELELTRNELHGQRTALEKQVEAAARQRLDSTFFQMLGLHHEIVARVKYGSYEGRAAFRPLVISALARHIDTKPEDPVAVDDLEKLHAQFKEIADIYEGEYPHWERLLGHYFRNLYRIVKYVDEAMIPDPDTYTGLVRAQLSSDELAVLWYNMFAAGYEKFLPLAERYELFQNMRSTALISPKHAELLQRHRAQRGEKWLHLADDLPG